MVKSGGIPPLNSSIVGLFPNSRPVVRGVRGMVSSGHYLVSMSAMRILLSGGNAFDAAAAAGFAAAVMEPISFTLASEGSFSFYHAATQQIRVLCGQGVAPKRATVDFYLEKGMDLVPTGPGPNSELGFTVPGVVDAFMLMLETYGTKSLGEVLAPAIEYAQGSPMTDYLRSRLHGDKWLANQIKSQFQLYPPGGMETFYPGGEPPQVGEPLVQKALAGTFRKLAHAEREAGGHRVAGIRAARDMFYRGDLARTIAACSERVGGLLDFEDLASYSATFEEPISTTYMGHEFYTQSVWTQGAVTLQALNILEHFDLRAMGYNSTQYIHTVTEALKLALADRNAYYGDPNFASVPIAGLLSKEYAASRARMIRPDMAWPECPDPGDPWRYCVDGTPPAPVAIAATAPTPGERGEHDERDTTHFVVMDRDGNIVSATPSGGFFGTSVFFPELGCTISNRSEMFYVDAQHPNGIQPGKRPRTTLINYIICKDGQPVMTTGCPGGDRQAQGNLQLILNVLVFGMDPQQAVSAPRFATQSMIGSFHPHTYRPGQLDVEPGISGEVRAGLQALGHKVVEAYPVGFTAIVIQRDPDTGTMSAGADPRRTTYAIGW